MTVLMEIVVHHLAVHVSDTAAVSIIILSSAAINRRTVFTWRSRDCSLLPNQQFSKIIIAAEWHAEYQRTYFHEYSSIQNSKLLGFSAK